MLDSAQYLYGAFSVLNKVKILIAVALFCCVGISAGQVVEFKADAPKEYTVKEGDTLWDIAGLYLDKPWFWPKIWQNNPDIQNPHLIYPGDVLLFITNESGALELTLQRSGKKAVKLSPKTRKTIKNMEPVPTLPWHLLETYVRNDLVIEGEAYQQLPYLLGNQDGAVRFATGDTVLSKGSSAKAEHFAVIRERQEIVDLEGETLGLLVKHVAKARHSPLDTQDQFLINIEQAKLEAKPGDRLLPIAMREQAESLVLQPAEGQVGQIVMSLHDRSLMGKYDIAVVDLGVAEVSPGTVMGIYLQGPDILDSDPITYQQAGSSDGSHFNFSDRIEQPALKVGEMVIFKVFGKSSFGLIIASTNVIRIWAFVANP